MVVFLFCWVFYIGYVVDDGSEYKSIFHDFVMVIELAVGF